MQVQIETKPKEWQPKTLSITFETEAEYDMFKEMIVWDVTIPSLVYQANPRMETKLKHFLQSLQAITK